MIRRASQTSLVDQFGNRIVTDEPKTGKYRPMPIDRWGIQLRDLPLFTFFTIRDMQLDQTIRLGVAMRTAPLMAVEIAYKEGDKWVPGVKADRPDVADFIERTLHRLWRHDVIKIINSQIWGWAAAEIIYQRSKETGRIEFKELLGRHARDAMALEQGGNFVGVEFHGVQGAKGQVRLGTPGNALWHAFEAPDGSFYGASVLKNAYSAWADKWLNGGALDVRRLFMHGDAYGGKTMRYPTGSTEIDGISGGGSLDVPNRDIAREMVEQAKAGEVMVMPSAFDENGNQLWGVEQIHVPSNPTHILQYPKDLDIEMLRGMEIPDDFLISGQTGAWQGKQVPMQGFYSGLNRFALNIIRTVVTQMLEPLVFWNWGKAVGFEVDIKPLDVQAMEVQKGQEGASDQEQQLGGAPGGFGEQAGQPEAAAGAEGEGIRFAAGTDGAAELVGSGVVAARDLIEGVKRIGSNGANNNGRRPDGDHEFSSTQFNLGDDIGDAIMEFANKNIAGEDLATDGIERNPHITVQFGLHADTPDQLQHVLRDQGPVAVRLGKTHFFEADGHDVIYISVESAGLHDLHCRIGDCCPHTDTHPFYIPHVTVAFVKPDLGERYAGFTDFDGLILSFDELVFSDKQNNHSGIPLTGFVRFAQLRAPKGGVTIGGEFFPGGRFIPDENLASASAEEREALEQAQQQAAGEKRGSKKMSPKVAEFAKKAREFELAGRPRLAKVMITKARNAGASDEQLSKAGLDLEKLKNKRQTAERRKKEKLVGTKRTAGGKVVLQNGKALPKHLKGIPIPPAWKNVKINPDPKGKLLVEGIAPNGKRQPIYSASFRGGQDAMKFARVKELSEKFESISKQNEANRKKPGQKENADVMALIMETGLRAGTATQKQTRAAKKSFGATQLEGRHVKVLTGGKVRLQFTGKKGVKQNITVDDPKVAKMLVSRAQKSGPKGKLFDTNGKKLLQYTKTLDGGGFKTHNMRTHIANVTASAAIKEFEDRGYASTKVRGKTKRIKLPPSTAADYKLAAKAIGERVSQKLGNTPTVALQSYVSPELLSGWRVD